MMNKFKELGESLNQPYEYLDYGSSDYTFDTENGDIVHVQTADIFYDDENQQALSFAFSRRDLTNMSKLGDAFRIFATILRRIKDDRHHFSGYNSFIFNSKIKEKGRIKFYNSLSKKIFKILDYDNLVIEDYDGLRYYILTDESWEKKWTKELSEEV